MKIYFLILSTILVKFSYAQEDEIKFYDDWIAYKIEMVDGSNLIDRYLTDSSFVRFSISDQHLGINFNPLYKLNESNLVYTLIDDYMQVSLTSGYIIEKIELDTLVLREQIDGLGTDKLKRLYFVSESRMFDKMRDLKGQSKNQIANQYFTPTLNSYLQKELNNEFLKHHSNYKLSGKILIHIKEQKIETIIVNSSTSNFNKINRIAKVINGSFELWNLDKFNDYETIEIPFILRDQHNRRGRGINMKFYTTSINQFDIIIGGHTKDLKDAARYYSFALEAYNQKKFTKSIKNFTRSYRLDPINIDALYNRAAIYSEIGENKKACIDWKKLYDLGQMQGIELYETHCKTTYNNR